MKNNTVIDTANGMIVVDHRIKTRYDYVAIVDLIHERTRSHVLKEKSIIYSKQAGILMEKSFRDVHELNL